MSDVMERKPPYYANVEKWQWPMVDGAFDTFNLVPMEFCSMLMRVGSHKLRQMIPTWTEACGYVLVANPVRRDGKWLCGGCWPQQMFCRIELSPRRGG